MTCEERERGSNDELMFAKGFGLLGWHKLHKHRILLLSCCLEKGETGRSSLLTFWASSRGQVRGTGNDQQLPRDLRAEQGTRTPRL